MSRPRPCDRVSSRRDSGTKYLRKKSDESKGTSVQSIRTLSAYKQSNQALIVRIVLLYIPQAPRTHQEERMDSSDYIITTSRTSARNLMVIPIYMTINRVIHLCHTVLSSILLYTTASSSQRIHREIYLRNRSEYFGDLGVETVHSDRHLWGIEGVFHHCICICFVNFLQRYVRTGVRYGSDKDKLGSCS